MTAAVRAKGIEKHYRAGLFGRRRALGPIDLELERGARLGLIGPNGSGKSTLLALLAGVERPSRGTIEVFGHSPSSSLGRAAIGYCPEDAPFPAELSARAFLCLSARLQGLDRRRSRTTADAWLTRVGLAPAASRALGAFSRGMLRRLSLAQALLADPELVLLDEPTAGLDAEGYEVLGDLLAELVQRRATLVLCSHAMADVHAHADELAVLADGRIAARGTLENLAREHGSMELELSGATADALTRIRAAAESSGARVVASRPTERALREHFGHQGGPRGGARD